MTFAQEMKRITEAAWNRVIEKACDVVNATEVDDDPMYEVHHSQMLGILEDLEKEFGTHPQILDTRADYLDDPVQRRSLYMRALIIARDSGDQNEEEVILQSLRDLEGDIEEDSASIAK